MPVPSDTDRAPIQRRLLRDEAEDAIREAILQGQFAPGEHLDDKALQGWLGISRTPVREALHGLEIQGLVETVAQSYTRVAAPTPEIIGDLVQTIGMVLAGTMWITIPTLNNDNAQKLLDAIDTVVKAAIDAQDAEGHLDAAATFYETLLPICPNTTLAQYVRASLVSLSYQYRANLDSWTIDWPALRTSWIQLQEALLRRDAAMAEQSIRRMHGLPSVGAHLPSDTMP